MTKKRTIGMIIKINPMGYVYNSKSLSYFESAHEYDPRRRNNGMQIDHRNGVHIGRLNGVYMVTWMTDIF